MDIKLRQGPRYSQKFKHGRNKMGTISKSGLKSFINVQFFKVSVEGVLLYGKKSWAQTTATERYRNGC